MNLHNARVLMSLLLTIIPTTSAVAQKIKVGYDKGANFSRYKSYSLAQPAMPPTRPFLYASIVGSIDHELKSKGFARTEGEGDLTLIPEGGTEFGLNQAAGTPMLPTYSGRPVAIDATMWTGAGGSAASMGMYVPEGTLRLDFVDRLANKVVWSGTVNVKLDLERKSKSLEVVDKAIIKLLKNFPPKNK
jgi:hypothetical protein